MKELKELGFEYLPTRTEFDKALEKSYKHYGKMWFISSEYRNLISQKPKLGDFIPCIDGVPVDEPVDFENWRKYGDFGRVKEVKNWGALCRQYKKALEQVKFEGWTIYHRNQYSTLIVNKSQMLNMVANGTLHGELFEDIYKTYEQAINYGVKFKIK